MVIYKFHLWFANFTFDVNQWWGNINFTLKHGLKPSPLDKVALHAFGLDVLLSGIGLIGLSFIVIFKVVILTSSFILGLILWIIFCFELFLNIPNMGSIKIFKRRSWGKMCFHQSVSLNFEISHKNVQLLFTFAHTHTHNMNFPTPLQLPHSSIGKKWLSHQWSFHCSTLS